MRMISKERQASIHTLDFLQITIGNQLPLTMSNPLNSRITTFDIIPKKKGPRTLSF